MGDPIDELKEKASKYFSQKQTTWQKEVYNSQQYQQEIKYINDLTNDFVNALRTISIYSTRAGGIYEDFLCIRTIDDVIQSAIAIQMMAHNGIHNTVKRELRYLIELTTKYVTIDYEKMGETFSAKTQYLKEKIPNSSIDVIDHYATPFTDPLRSLFKSEVKDLFYKACAYVHPSKKQIDEQIANYERGNTLGFESAKMFTDINKSVFRAYDIILTMIFHGFGHSMTKDLFEQVFNENLKWKYHKGKYVEIYSKILFYKS